MFKANGSSWSLVPASFITWEQASLYWNFHSIVREFSSHLDLRVVLDYPV